MSSATFTISHGPNAEQVIFTGLGMATRLSFDGVLQVDETVNQDVNYLKLLVNSVGAESGETAGTQRTALNICGCVATTIDGNRYTFKGFYDANRRNGKLELTQLPRRRLKVD